MSTLLDHLREHLIAEDLVRDPRVAGPRPPCWRHPRDGVPAPGEGRNPTEIGPDLVIGLLFAGGLVTRRFDLGRRRDIVDVVLRATTAPAAVDLGGEIRRVTIDRTNWQMGAITVIESEEWRPLQPLSTSQGFMFFTGLLFETYAE